MMKPSIATACRPFLLLLLLVALLGGCGGGSHSSENASSADRKTACAAATAGKDHYKETLTKLGLNVQNKLEVAHAVAATSEYRSSVEALERSANQTEKGQLAQLASALAQQEKVLTEFGAHNPAAAQDAQGLDQGLREGQANLSKVCLETNK